MDHAIVPVFDIGGVFIDWDPLHLYRKMFETEEEARWFVQSICTPEWNLSLDAGHPYEQAIAELSARFPRYWAEIAAYDTRWQEMVPQLYDETIAIHAHLVAEGVPTFAITNFSAKKWMEMLPHWPFMQAFDGVVVSGIEKLVKPDLRIFQLFCDRYGLAPQSCLFIDDNPANVAAARQVGMYAQLYEGPESLKAALRDHGLPVM